MSSVAIPSWLIFAEHTSAHRPRWLQDLQQQALTQLLQIGWPSSRQERWKYIDLDFLNKKYFSPNVRPLIDEYLRASIHHQRLRNEEAILLVLVNGFFMPALSDMGKLPNGVIASNLLAALENHPSFIETLVMKDLFHPFADLNTALCQDGLFLYLPDQLELSVPIHFLSITTDHAEFMANPRHFFYFRETKSLCAD